MEKPADKTTKYLTATKTAENFTHNTLQQSKQRYRVENITILIKTEK